LALITDLWAREPSFISGPSPLHRDFYPAQVIARNSEIAFVDLDDSAMGDPLIDVANFMAHVTLLSFRRFTDPDRLAKARRAFSDAYSERNPDLKKENLPFYEASTLIRLASLASDHSRILETDVLLGQAREVLS
jgi:aminoglycoside phosphotransferase (APT) family kinase protein